MLKRIKPSILFKITHRSHHLVLSLFSTKAVPVMASEKFNFDEVFTAENKRRTIADLSELQAQNIFENFLNNSMKKTAAVLIPLCYDLDNRPSLLYNLRSKSMSKHKGEICFPGGGVEPEDNDDVIVAALRETEEELGISRDEIEIWTTLPYVPTVSSVVKVAPVLGFIKKPVDVSKLKLNPAEVELAFTIPLEFLCNQENWSTTQVTKRLLPKYMQMPAFNNLEKFLGGESVTLWGLTAITTHMVLTFLVPQVYQREIPISSRAMPKPKI